MKKQKRTPIFWIFVIVNITAIITLTISLIADYIELSILSVLSIFWSQYNLDRIEDKGR